MANVQTHQGQAEMQLIRMIREVLDTGVLSMSVERQLQTLLSTQEMTEPEMQVVDELIDALTAGRVQTIA